VLPNPWLTKPPPGTGLNRASGLAQGLAAFWPMLESSGPKTYDIVTGLPLAITGAPWGSGLSSGLVCTSNGAGAQATVPAALQLGFPISLAVGFRVLQTPGLSQPVWGLENGSGRIASIETQSGLDVLLYFNTSNNTPTTSIAIGADYVAVATIGNGAQSLYVNGAYAGGGTASFSPSYSGAYFAVSGPTFFGGIRNPGSLVYWTALWSRVLSPAEAGALYTNPWQMLGPNPSYWLYRSGSTVFSFTGSGGVIGGGSASPSSAFAPPAAGGVELGGAAAGSLVVIASAAGGLELGGTATHAATYAPVPAGGIELGGIAILPGTFSFTASGGAALGGGASESFVTTASAAGGLELGGTATAGIVGATFFIYVDPDAGSLIVTADDPGEAEVDPDAGSLVIV
jgi:hypothetical protein